MAERNNPLSRFELSGVEEKGREIGRGSYAVVEELDFHGLSCVSKSIHKEIPLHQLLQQLQETT